MSTPPTRGIELLPITGISDPLELRSGPGIAPIERLKIFFPEQREHFVDEWVSSLATYARVERTAGAGDMGCDVVAYHTLPKSAAAWDNYQCKHYEHALRPSDIWVELGKLAFYTFEGAFSLPTRYNFVAPRGVGTKLNRLLRDPEAFAIGTLAELGRPLQIRNL